MTNEINFYEKFLNRMSRTRKNKMQLHKRLKSYNEKVNTLLFFMNFFGIVLIIITLNPNQEMKNIFILNSYIVAIISIYIILFQYYIIIKSYDKNAEKALNIYHELREIENEINDGGEKVFNNKKDKYFYIYNSILNNSIPHDDIDDLNNKLDDLNVRKRDLSLDNIVINGNIIVCLGGYLIVFYSIFFK